MTAEDIARHREFLDDSKRYGKGRGTRSMAMTTKPCPGCGNSREHNQSTYPEFWNRPADRVCNECRQLLNEALSSQEKRLAQSDYKLYFVERRGYYEGHKPHKSGWLLDVLREEWITRMHDSGNGALDPSVVIGESLCEIAKALAADFPEVGVPSADSVYSSERNAFSTPRGQKLWLRPEHAFLLRVMDAAIRQALTDRSEAGEEHGRNLLSQLATGELSVQKFNDLTINKNT